MDSCNSSHTNIPHVMLLVTIYGQDAEHTLSAKKKREAGLPLVIFHSCWWLTSDGASCAHSRHQYIHLPSRVPPNLRPRGLVVHGRVGGVFKLLQHVGVRPRGDQLLGFADCTRHALHTTIKQHVSTAHQHNVGAKLTDNWKRSLSLSKQPEFTAKLMPSSSLNTQALPTIFVTDNGEGEACWSSALTTAGAAGTAWLAGVFQTMLSYALANSRQISSLHASAVLTQAFTLRPSVSTSCAPSALSSTRRSMLMVSGMVSTSW